MTTFGYPCEYCQGTVQPKRVQREAFKHKAGIVILEDLVIGLWDACGNRYYSGDTLRQAEDIVIGRILPERVEEVAVGRAS